MIEPMSAERALAVYDLLDAHGVGFWVMGGWGVDALLGRVSRAHKDLDLLVHLSGLRAYSESTRSHGFSRKLEWSESRPIQVDGRGQGSAFVDAHPDGREIDVHVIGVDEAGGVIQLYDDPWPLPTDTLSGSGKIAGREVRCVSRAAQLAMHSNTNFPRSTGMTFNSLGALPDAEFAHRHDRSAACADVGCPLTRSRLRPRDSARRSPMSSGATTGPSIRHGGVPRPGRLRL